MAYAALINYSHHNLLVVVDIVGFQGQQAAAR